jgi:hypothetical protein
MLPLPPALSSSLFLYPSAHSDFPVGVCDMTELDIGEDAVSWYNEVKLQLPASAPLTDLSHQEEESDRSFQCVSEACREIFENPGKFHSEVIVCFFCNSCRKD